MDISIDTPHSSFCSSWGVKGKILFFNLKVSRSLGPTGTTLRYSCVFNTRFRRVVSKLMNPDASIGTLYNKLVKGEPTWFRVDEHGYHLYTTIHIGTRKVEGLTLPPSKNAAALQRQVDEVIATIRDMYEVAILEALTEGRFAALSQAQKDFDKRRAEQLKRFGQ